MGMVLSDEKAAKRA